MQREGADAEKLGGPLPVGGEFLECPPDDLLFNDGGRCTARITWSLRSGPIACGLLDGAVAAGAVSLPVDVT